MLKLPDFFLRVIQMPGAWWSTLIGWAVVECVLSTIPGSSMPQIELVNFDKVEHVSFFTIGAFLLTGALFVTFPRWPWWPRLLLAIGCISLFGRIDEWRQGFTPGRSGNDFYDWLSDTVGGIVGASAARWIIQYVWTSRRLGPLSSGEADRLPAERSPQT